MDSFYGGKPGHSFIIVKTFETVDDMKNAFKEGPNYTDVHYNEHVLINTKNRLNPENGQVYRRGYDYSNESTAGAIYVGTIVGPPGAAPKVKLNTFQEIDKQYNADAALGENYQEKVQGSYNPGRDLLPGALGPKTADGRQNYNDNILWEYYLFRDKDGIDATVYIGFKFPYLVVDFSATPADPYKTGELASKVHPTEAEVVAGNIKHPYYQSFHIDVPKGKKGDSFQNLQVITAASNDEITKPDEYISNGNHQNDIDNEREILVYDFYNYDNSATGTKTRWYLGDYNMIDDISLNTDTGTLTIQYSHDDDYVAHLRWPTKITLDADGTIKATYTTAPSPVEIGPKIQWINSVILDDDGNFTVTYNTKEDSGVNKTYKNQLDWIKSAALNVTDGTLTFTHTTGETNQAYLQWVKNLDVGADGTITLYYTNNGTSSEAYSTTLKNKIKWVNKIEITDSKIETTFNDGRTTSHEYNYIVKTAITDNYELLVHYSNPTKNTTPDATHVSYNGEDWQKIGVLKNESGILIGLNLTTATTGTDIVSYLNKTYPSGLNSLGTDLRGKVVTVGDVDADKKFYAFDYVTKKWFFLGEIQENPIFDGKNNGLIPIPTTQSDSSFLNSKAKWIDITTYLQFGTATAPATLPVGGVYFQVDE